MARQSRDKVLTCALLTEYEIALIDRLRATSPHMRACVALNLEIPVAKQDYKCILDLHSRTAKDKKEFEAEQKELIIQLRTEGYFFATSIGEGKVITPLRLAQRNADIR